MEDRFLNALKGANFDRPPVWFMRQAGRYLPEYQALRQKYSLRDMFFTPALAAETTLMPLRRFAFDAAILFSDITSIAPALGFSLVFQEGPLVSPRATPINWRHFPQNLALLDPIAEAAALTKQQLMVPLIGFCGGPFTIATYLIEKHDGTKIPLTREWMRSDPASFEDFLDHLCDMCIHSLKVQIAAGVDAVQVFDSWANALDDDEFEKYSLKLLRKICQAIDHPVILFMRGSSIRAEKLSSIPKAILSIDMGRKLSEIRSRIKCPLQGNLDPDLLFKPLEEVRSGVQSLLQEMKGDPGFIFNLGHGVKPGTPIEAVSLIIEEILRSK